jgi:phosphatidylglycerol:prolipoprotein diacylglycerol transferase
MEFLAIPFPGINPVAFEIGPLSVKWYGLGYMASLLFAWWYIKQLLRTPQLWRGNKAPFSPLLVDDLLLWITIGVVVGGRLGQVLLYDPGYYLHHPIEIFEIWRGGMAFHGALILSGILILIFSRIHKVDFATVTDLCCAGVALGIGLVRITNFINAEHFGRPSDVPWAMVFPGGGNYTRHPSQLYESLLEGFVMFAILRLATHKFGALKSPGIVTGIWLIWYAVARTICEFFRDPEPVHALNLGPFTAGQMYSIPMVLLGLWFIWRARRGAAATPANA